MQNFHFGEVMDKQKFNTKFGEFVKSKREALGMSQSDIAAKMNIDYQSISRLERGKVAPTLYWCYGLAEALEIPLPKLLEEFTKKKK